MSVERMNGHLVGFEPGFSEGFTSTASFLYLSAPGGRSSFTQGRKLRLLEAAYIDPSTRSLAGHLFLPSEN